MEHGIKPCLIFVLIMLLLSGCSIKKQDDVPIDILCEMFNTGRYDSCNLVSLDLYYDDLNYFFEVNSIERAADAFDGEPIELNIVYAIGQQYGWFTPEFYEIQGMEELYRKYCYTKTNGTHYVYTDDELREIEKELNP